MSLSTKEEKDRLASFLSQSKLSLKTHFELYSKEAASDVWKNFGYISLECEYEDLCGDSFVFHLKRVSDFVFIDRFVACFLCKQVYQHIPKQGTSTLKHHKCSQRLDPRQLTIPQLIHGEKSTVI